MNLVRNNRQRNALPCEAWLKACIPGQVDRRCEVRVAVHAYCHIILDSVAQTLLSLSRAEPRMKICLTCGQRHDRPDWSCPSCGGTPARCQGFISFAPNARSKPSGTYDHEILGDLTAAEGRGHFWFRSRVRLLAWALQCYFPRARSFLEIGCGTGFVLLGFRRLFPDLRLAGGEISYEGLIVAAERVPEAVLFQMDARTIPFENEFDVVGAFDVLEHVEEDDAILRQMYQATKPGGGIIITVPQHRWFWTSWDIRSGHRRRYARDQMVQKMKNAGFRVVRTTSFATFLLPLMLLARMLEWIGLCDATMELKAVPRLNTCLEQILGLEHLLICAGMSLPAGASLLVIGRKTG